MPTDRWEKRIKNKDKCPIYKLIKLFHKTLSEEERSIRWFYLNYMKDTGYSYEAVHSMVIFKHNVMPEMFLDGVMRYLLDVKSSVRGKTTKYNPFKTTKMTKRDIEIFMEVYNGN